MTEDKDTKDFKREFRLIGQINRLPYYEIINQNDILKNDLYQEFLKTPKKVCLHLYLDSKGFTDQYIQDGLSEVNSRIPRSNGSGMAGFVASSQFENKERDLRNECYDLAAQNKLPQSFYCHDINKTPIVKALYLLGTKVDRFKSSVKESINVNQYDTDAKIFAFSVVSELDKLCNPQLKGQIVKALLDDNENIAIFCGAIFGSNEERIETKAALNRYEKLKEHLDFHLKSFLIDTSDSIARKDKLALKIPQIALIFAYEGKHITKENASDIASSYGYSAKYSGHGLYQDFLEVCTTSNRIAKPNPFTISKLKNKIKKTDAVLKYLTNTAKKLAIDELEILKMYLSNESE